MAPWTPAQFAAAAQALERAAERFEARAAQIDERVDRQRKARPYDPAPTVASTLHDVARELRNWAKRCAQ